MDQVKEFIRAAIADANQKSSRVILSIRPDESPENIAKK
jgi:hypothetical protein